MRTLLLIAGSLVVGSIAIAQDLTTGNVVAGVANGQYDVYTNAGVYIETLTDGLGGFTTGAAYNTSTNRLYTTNISNSTIVVYDGFHPHTIVQSIPTGPLGGASVESIVFDSSGNFYAGHAFGDQDIKKFDPTGTFVDTYDVATENVGSDWIDLAIDQKTIFYTSEGRRVMRYDVQAETQLADFALLPGGLQAFALRLLPPFDGTGGLIVADRDDILRLDGTGAVAQFYDAPGEDDWFAMNLDPNGTSFWAGSFGLDNFYRFNIASGAVELGPINAGPGNTLFGLAVVGEITGAVPTPFCFGDGTSVPCPCNNNGAVGNGCANSDHPGGAKLAATGTPSLSNDTLVLNVTDQHASSLSLFLQGDAEIAPMNFGDGLRCIDGNLRRIFRVKNAQSTSVSAPSAASLPPSPATISGQSSARGDALSPGDIRGYQVYYRDPDPLFCPSPQGGTFNVTNAVRVTWGI